MNPNLRTGIFSLAVLLVGGALAGCTSQEVTTGTGGSGGSGTGTGGAGGGGGDKVACGSGPFAPSTGVVCPAPSASA